MSGEATEVIEQPSYLEMSDEEILKMGAPALPAATEADSKDEKDESKAKTEDTEDQADADSDGDKGDEDEEAGASKASKSEGAGDGDADDSGDEPDAKAKTKSPASEDKTKEEKADETDPEAKEQKEPDEKAIDYKAEYERLMSSFKANGKEFKLASPDEARTLMQMGANYAKKMAALKPNLKLLKSLENAGLLSEEKLGFLIDLSRKDPGAINKLVKESGIDPMELDAEKATAYKPKTYAVDDKEVELDTVLDELDGSETYTRTLDVVSNKWDAASKRVISDSPQLLKVIDDHMASGIYDLISAEVERGRVLGRLSGLSDIEAYRKVGDEINARGGFNHLFKQETKTTQPPDVIPAKAKKAKEDDKLNEKRRAASSTKPAAPAAKVPADFNPLAMSDEEFSKLDLTKFK